MTQVWTHRVWGGDAAGGTPTPSTPWRFAPASWLTDNRAALQGAYGSTYHGALMVLDASNYIYFLHSDGTSPRGFDPGLRTGGPSGTGHAVTFGAGNLTDVQVAALAQPVIDGIAGFTCTDNGDGTVEVGGTSSISTGTPWPSASPGGLMGTRIDELTTAEAGVGGLNNCFCSQFQVSGTSETRRIRAIQIWIESADASDDPRCCLYAGSSTNPGAVIYDFGNIDASAVSAPGWVTLWVDPSANITVASGDFVWLAGRSTLNLTALRYISTGDPLRGDWDATVGLSTDDGSMSSDQNTPFEDPWVGGVSSGFPIVFPCRIIYSDDSNPAGDGSYQRRFGTFTPETDFGSLSQVVLPQSLVFMGHSLPNILGMRLGDGYFAFGDVHDSAGSMRLHAWTGGTDDPTSPHLPNPGTATVIYNYGTESGTATNAWVTYPGPSTAVNLTPGSMFWIGCHSSSTSTIRFEQQPPPYEFTVQDRDNPSSWYVPTGIGNGSEYEAFAATNPNITADQNLPPISPFVNDPSDTRPGNVAGLAVDLIVDGMSEV